MSQAKVDQYKKEKANRKATIAKEKRIRVIGRICSGILLCGLAVWVGISTVNFIKDSRPVETIYCQTDAIDTYLNGIFAEETAEEVVEATTEVTE